MANKQVILVVDDSSVEAQVVKRILEKYAFTVEVAQDAISGIAKAHELLPDLILMDVVMPGMNGFQATRHITRSKDTKHIPVLMLTTKAQETDKVWGIRQGAKAYLVKPTNDRDLLTQVHQWLN